MAVLETNAGYGIGQMASNYWADVPSNAPQEILKGFAFGFVFGVIVLEPFEGVILGTLMATATTIHALITPLFKKIITDRTTLSWSEEILRSGLGILGAYPLAVLAGPTFSSQMEIPFLWLAICCCFKDFRNIDKTHIIIY